MPISDRNCSRSTAAGVKCPNYVMRDGLCFSHHPDNAVVSCGRVARKAENLARSLAATRAEYAARAQADADRANAEAQEWAAKKVAADPGAMRFLEELTGARLQ